MGFNLYNLGVIRECWLENGMLKFKSPVTGEVTACETDLSVEAHPQKNVFYSKTVAFFLTTKDADRQVKLIGRYDGKISIIDAKSGLLVGLKNWVVPPHPPTAICGYYKPMGMVYEVALNLSDKQSLYCGYHNIEARLISPADYDFDLSYAVGMCEQSAGSDKLHIYRKGGTECGTEFWTVQDELWKHDCTIFL